MNILIKTAIYIITFFIFSLLIFSTFITPQYEKIKSLDTKNNINKYETISSTGAIKDVYIENISKIDSIYYSNSGSYNKKGNEKNLVFELNKGNFLLNINDISTNYIFSHKGFNIEALGAGTFYIDTNNINNIKIFSKEAILKIGFKDLITGEILNNAFLYPHEYIIINPIRNRAIKNNADFIRVKSQIFKSGYINDKINYSKTKEALLGKLIGDKYIYFFDTSLKDIILKDGVYIKKYEKLKNLSYWTFSGINFVEKYISYFYNNSKKIVYFKNSIIKNNLILFGKNDTKTYVLRKNIKDTLEKLKEIDKAEYNKMLDFTNYIYNSTFKNNSLEDDTINISRKLNFYNLKLELDNKSNKFLYPSSIYIKSIFYLYDKGEIDNLNKYLNTFIELFYKDLGVEDKLGKLNFNKKVSSQIDYLSFYLRNYISYAFLSNDSIENSLDLINSYIILSKNIYFNSSDKDRIKTGIHEGVFFLEKLDNYIINNLFKEERNKKGLLVKSDKFNLDIESIKKLDNNIKKLDFAISSNMELLENKESFEKTKKHFKEYFEALLDYELYLYNYDEAQNNILNLKTAGSKNNKNKLSRENFIEYISQFEGINNNSIYNMEFDIIDNQYYKIKNLYINGNSISFNLYPYQNNKLTSIYINSVEKDKQLFYNSTYYLDIQEEELKEKLKNINDEKEKNKYEFKRFFINKFFTKKTLNKNNNIIEEKNNKKLDESKVIIVFKSEILLGKKGEFNIIKDTININYNDLLVKRIGDNYDIYINGSLISTMADKDKVAYGLLYGNYVLNNTSHYFNNLKIAFYSEYEDNKKILGAGGNKINIIGKINIEDFKNQISKFFINSKNIDSVFKTINTTYLEISNLKINYNIINNEVNFNFTNKNNNIEISFKGSIITNISINSVEIKGFNNLNNLQNILLIINK